MPGLFLLPADLINYCLLSLDYETCLPGCNFHRGYNVCAHHEALMNIYLLL